MVGSGCQGCSRSDKLSPREGCQRLTGPCVTPTPHQTLEQLLSQQHHVPHTWSESSPCPGVAVIVAATTEFMGWAGWWNYFCDSGLCVQLCPV